LHLVGLIKLVPITGIIGSNRLDARHLSRQPMPRSLIAALKDDASMD
jgi:hypothetical protein